MKKAIVIGGGIAGCSTAYSLAKRGVTVTLIERHQHVAQEASGNPVAMLYPRLESGSNLASKGFAYTNALLKELPNSHTFHQQCGQIQLAFNARERGKQAALLNNLTDAQNVQLLTVTEASKKANIELDMGGLYLPEAGWVKPQALCNSLLQSSHITCLTSTDVTSLKDREAHWEISLGDNKTLEADTVIICNANNIKQFDQCKQIPVTAVRGQVNFFAENQLSKQINTALCTDHFLCPNVDGMHSIGTSYAPNDINPNLSIEDTHNNLQALKIISSELFNHIDLSQVTGRVAWRSTTKDYLPLAGQLIDEKSLRTSTPRNNDLPTNLPWLQGLYINAGHGSKGMITAPLCAELLANNICGESLVTNQALASKLNPSRFLLRDVGLKRMAQNLYST